MTFSSDGKETPTHLPTPQQENNAETVLDWQDADGKSWRIELQSAQIILLNQNDKLEIPQSNWANDIYIAEHGQCYIVRFETFSYSIGFVITDDQAQPLFTHIGKSPDTVLNIEKQLEAEEDAPVKEMPLLWPKVSPLAVWALISSSMVFMPVLGLLPALITVTLLVLHRIKVSKVPAYRHSRKMCTFAFIFLLVGGIVSVLGTYGNISNLKSPVQPYPSIQRPPHSSSDAQRDQSASPPIVKAGMMDKKHNWGLIAAALFVVLLSLTVHEAAHAISAWWLGDDFARRIGRVTLNPAVHIDPFGTVLFPLLLFMAGMGIFGWAKPVPVRLDYVPRPRRAHILISMAGPGSNLLLAAASVLLLIGIGCVIKIIAPHAVVTNLTSFDFTQTVSMSGFSASAVIGPLFTILKLSFFVNVFLAFFNLIPIPPLDGSWVLQNLFPRTLGPIYDKLRPYSFIMFILLLYSELLPTLLLPAMIVIANGLTLVGDCTFG